MFSKEFSLRIPKKLNDIKVLSEYTNSKTKILVEDSFGIRYLVFPETLLRGCRPKITSAVDIQNAFIRKLKKYHPDLKLVSEYNGANNYVNVQDSISIIYRVTPGFLLSAKSKPSIKAAIDKTDAFKKIVYNKRTDLEIIGEYKGDKREVLLKDKYGIFHKMLPYNIMKGNSLTLKSAVEKTEYVRAIVKLTHPDLKLIGKYRSAYDKIMFEDELGIKYSILFNNLIKSKRAISIKSAINKTLAVNKIIKSVRKDIDTVVKFSSAKEQLIIKDLEGFKHKMSMYSLLDGNVLSLNSVLDKSTYFDYLYTKINIHGYKRVTSYKGYTMPLTLKCQKHGSFISTPEKLLFKTLCEKCSRELRFNSLEDFVEKANRIHVCKYDYTKSVYKGFNSRIDIICPKHGKFNQLVKGHLSGKGCKKCVQESQTGTLASVSKYNPNLIYKLYKLFVWSDDRKEVFGKVGLTLDVKRRIWGIPYNVKLIELKEGKISDLFKEEQNFFLEIRRLGLEYLPKIKFGGYTECYKLSKEDIENYERYNS
jgi:hypothetical protein